VTERGFSMKCTGKSNLELWEWNSFFPYFLASLSIAWNLDLKKEMK
jgi:hypothetical protein